METCEKIPLNKNVYSLMMMNIIKKEQLFVLRSWFFGGKVMVDYRMVPKNKILCVDMFCYDLVNDY